MNIGALLASGAGSRVGGELPKQYMPLAGAPVFAYAAQTLLDSDRIDRLVICVSAEYRALAEKLTSEHIRSDKPVDFVCGGATRSESLLNTLEFCRERGLFGGVIVTHDAARPFLTAEMIADSVDKCLGCGAAICCKSATDTMFITDGDGAFIKSVPDRRTVFHAQTPQTFVTSELYEAIVSLPREEFLAMTDAGSVYARLGRPVAVSLGSEDNIKITYPADFVTAENTVKRLKLCLH